MQISAKKFPKIGYNHTFLNFSAPLSSPRRSKKKSIIASECVRVVVFFAFCTYSTKLCSNFSVIFPQIFRFSAMSLSQDATFVELKRHVEANEKDAQLLELFEKDPARFEKFT